MLTRRKIYAEIAQKLYKPQISKNIDSITINQTP